MASKAMKQTAVRAQNEGSLVKKRRGKLEERGGDMFFYVFFTILFWGGTFVWFFGFLWELLVLVLVILATFYVKLGNADLADHSFVFGICCCVLLVSL